MVSALNGQSPPSLEDQERIEVKTYAACELDHIRLGRLAMPDQIVEAIDKLIAWFDRNFSPIALVDPAQTIHVRDALLCCKLLDEKAQTIPGLLQAVAYIKIVLRGIIFDPEAARSSIATIEKMRDFCLALARA